MVAPPKTTRRRRLVVVLVLVIALVAGGVTAWLLSGGSLPGSSTATAGEAFRDLGSGVSVTDGAPATLTAVSDDHVTKPPFSETESLGGVVHITPDGDLPQPVTLRFALNRPAEAADVVIAVNRTGAADGWELVTPSKVKDGYAFVTTNHLSWWDPLFRSFGNLVDAAKAELKKSFDSLTGDAFADAEKPKCPGEQDARNQGYSIGSKGSDPLYWCLGIEGGKPTVRIVDKRRYPILVNHAGIAVAQRPKDRFGVEWLAQQSFSDKRTVLLPFDQAALSYELAKGQSVSFTTEYDGFAESLYQLEFGVTTLINILTRFGAGGGTISNGAIKIDQFDRITELAGKFLHVKECAGALNRSSPDVGAILAGCFDPATLGDVFGWKGVLLGAVLVVGPAAEFFRSQFETLSDLLQGRDRETVTVTYQPKPAIPFVGHWAVHGLTMDIRKDGTGSIQWNAGPCDSATSSVSRMCSGNATVKFTSTGAEQLTGTYTKVWYTDSGGNTVTNYAYASSESQPGQRFTLKRNDEHTLIASGGSADDPDGPGNPYLCDAYAIQHNVGGEKYDICGA